ncbi:MAG: hypothetical protein FWF72_00430 [Paludibacter sp.]|nr:hypothetical protein [Paludibacter sp.]
MANKTHNITKIAATVFLLLQFTVCFAEILSIDSKTSTVFIGENTAISVSGNGFFFVDNHINSIIETSIVFIGKNTAVVGTNHIFINNRYIKYNLIQYYAIIANSKLTEKSTHIHVKHIHTATQKNVLYREQFPFLFAYRNIVANVPTNNYKRQRKLLPFNGNFFNALSNLLKNNYLFKFYISKFAAVNFAFTDTIIRVFVQCGCLTAFSANSPPHFH